MSAQKKQKTQRKQYIEYVQLLKRIFTLSIGMHDTNATWFHIVSNWISWPDGGSIAHGFVSEETKAHENRKTVLIMTQVFIY